MNTGQIFVVFHNNFLGYHYVFLGRTSNFICDPDSSSWMINSHG
ncbi:unnamed protein product [Callosobruchus maculatus]|uniref:Uncharacterized protein n=1 Tax=Callosobruchus maculatus TaxID=64391 RepID=A0A653DMJ5_CALMS|nr:unnamed protein product [Callosobruchus maculatus]